MQNQVEFCLGIIIKKQLIIGVPAGKPSGNSFDLAILL